MDSVPYEEAIELLAEPLICPDVDDWVANRLKPNLYTVESGLVRKRGRCGLVAYIQVGVSPTTGIRTYKFGVFKLDLGAMLRVYMVQINAVAHRPKNWHDLVHEHFGKGRVDGSEDWLDWKFPQVLDYYCRRANITFLPPLTDPTAFALR